MVSFDAKGAAALEEYEDAAAKLLDHLEKFIVEQYGERCADFDPDCPTCKLWKLRDELVKTIA